MRKEYLALESHDVIWKRWPNVNRHFGTIHFMPSFLLNLVVRHYEYHERRTISRHRHTLFSMHWFQNENITWLHMYLVYCALVCTFMHKPDHVHKSTLNFIDHFKRLKRIPRYCSSCYLCAVILFSNKDFSSIYAPMCKVLKHSPKSLMLSKSESLYTVLCTTWNKVSSLLSQIRTLYRTT